MIHPLFMTALRRPELLLAHLGNYAALLKAEGSSLGNSLVLRAASAAVALAALLLALGLTGIAVMLGFLNGSFHWVLVIVPGTAWLLVLIGGTLAMQSNVQAKVSEVKEEVEADLRMLRLIKENRNE